MNHDHEHYAEKKDAQSAYVMPVLEHLGHWSALTLQQSVSITLLLDPETPSPLV